MGQKATEASRVDMGRLSAETANAILSSNPHAPAATLTTIRTMCRYRLCSACPRKCAATAMQQKHPDTIIRNNGIRLTRFLLILRLKDR